MSWSRDMEDILMDTRESEVIHRNLSKGLISKHAPTLKIVFVFKSGPCAGILFGIDVEYKTTIKDLKSYIRTQMYRRCNILDNMDIQLQLYGIPKKEILRDNEDVLALSRIVLRKPKHIECDIEFEVELTQFDNVKEFDGGRKSRRPNSKKNKRTRRKSLKKQHRRK